MLSKKSPRSTHFFVNAAGIWAHNFAEVRWSVTPAPTVEATGSLNLAI